MTAEFPRKKWSVASVNRLLQCEWIRHVNHLKERLLEEWHHFDQRIIDRTVSQW